MSQTQPFQFEPKYATDEEGEESLSSSQSNSEDDEKASRIGEQSWCDLSDSELRSLDCKYFILFRLVVQEYERAVIFRLGRLLSGGPKGPGTFLVLPFIENYTKVDLRTLTFDVPPQEILTKDSVTVSVDAVVYYRVFNATVSVANVENAHHSTRLLAQTTLRNILGTKNLAELLSDRDTISSSIQNTLDGATDAWGIKVERVEMKDVRLPVQLQRAMAAEAEAAREARAKDVQKNGGNTIAGSNKKAIVAPALGTRTKELPPAM
ncbi:Stomatin-2 [Nymphon striatum]|nr:Stomatin-2 [Nymphon striatum]